MTCMKGEVLGQFGQRNNKEERKKQTQNKNKKGEEDGQEKARNAKSSGRLGKERTRNKEQRTNK